MISSTILSFRECVLHATSRGLYRMTAGTYGEGISLTTNVDRYSERMGYDANGNITSISRYGKKSSGYGLMDNLTITYSGNQLSNVSETVADYDYSGSFPDFITFLRHHIAQIENQ